MDNLSKLIADFSSLHWWVTVVVVGLLINLAAAYLKPYLDVWYATVSTKRKFKNDQERAAFEWKVEALASDPMLLVLECLQEQRYRLQTVVAFVVAFGAIGLGLYVGNLPTYHESLAAILIRAALLTSGFVCYVSALWSMRHAMARYKLVYAAHLARHKVYLTRAAEADTAGKNSARHGTDPSTNR